MKKSFLIKFFAVCLAIAILPLTACREIHTHNYVPTVTSPTCEHQGYTTHACECGVYYVNSYTNELDHNFEENVCSICGVYNYELAFTCENGVITGLTELGKTLSDFVIPRTINGEIVTQIADSAFEFKANIKSVVISRTITSIGQNAFKNCVNLGCVIIPKTVLAVANYAFRNCASLTIYYDGESIPGGWSNYWNYSNCRFVRGYTAYKLVNGVVYGLKNGCADVVKQPLNATYSTIAESVEYKGENYGVKTICDYAFSGCSFIQSLIIPKSVTRIGMSAFEGCSWLESVVIPASVIEIGENAFNNCNYLSINCEAAEKPSGWHNSWNPGSRPVTWSYNN